MNVSTACTCPMTKWRVACFITATRTLSPSPEILIQKLQPSYANAQAEMGHVWTVPAVQEESDLSAKRSGAAMYAACFSRRGLPRRDAAAVAAGPDVIR